MRAFLLFVAACGRLGFDPTSPPGDGSPDGAAEGTIGVHVLRDELLAVPAADAYVVLDDDTVLRTDAQGRVVIPAPAPRTFHVVHQQAAGFELGTWRVISLLDVDPGSAIELGPPGDSPQAGVLDLQATADGAADTYRVYGPTRCGLELNASNTPVFGHAFPASCTGTTGEIYLLSEMGGAVQGVSTSAPFTYGDGVDVVFGGRSAAPVTNVRVQNIPPGSSQLTASLYHAAASGDLYIVTTKNATPDPEVVIDVLAPLPANHIALIVAPQAFSATGMLGPIPNTAIDFASLPTPIGALNLDPVAKTLAWDDVSSAGIVLAQASIDGTLAQIQWEVIAPPSVRQVTFPALPAELPAIAPDASAAVTTASVVALFTDQLTTKQLREVIDRQLAGWFGGLALPPAPLSLVAATIAQP